MVFESDRSGFTLLELMIAVGVLIVALAGLLGVFSHMISLNENSGKLTLAAAACQDKLEEIRNSNFSALYTAYNGANFNPAGFSSTPSAVPAGKNRQAAGRLYPGRAGAEGGWAAR